MNRFFRIFALTTVLVSGLAACSVEGPHSIVENPENNLPQMSEGVVSGELLVCFSKHVSDVLEKEGLTKSRTDAPMTRSGLMRVDEILDLVDGYEIERVFPVDSRREDKAREAGLHLWYVVRFSDEHSVESVAEKLSKLGEVSRIEYNRELKRASDWKTIPLTNELVREMTSTRAVSQDPLYNLQWYLNNDGSLQNTLDRPEAVKFVDGADINAEQAWKKSTGHPSVIVAILDEGVDVNHPDLKASMWVNEGEEFGSTTDADGNGYAGDRHGYNFVKATGMITVNGRYDTGHGTHVAGTIAARNNNGIGLKSIAGGDGTEDSGVRIMSCQIFAGEYVATVLDEVRAIKYAADNGAVILQCSWGYVSGAANPYEWTPQYEDDEQWSTYNPLEKQALDYFTKTAGSPDGVIDGGIAVYAAGNESAGAAGYPGAYKDYVSVAAMAADFTIATYSNYGPGTTITAPGGDQDYYYEFGTGTNMGAVGCILSTLPEHRSDAEIDGLDGDFQGYGYMEGTSMATPQVSGVIALGLSYALEQRKHFKAQEFIDLLHSSATKFDDSVYKGEKKWYKYVIDMGKNHPSLMQLSDYKGKMGHGLVNAGALLDAIDGADVPTMTFPNVTLAEGADRTIDPAMYFVKGNTLGYTVTVENDAVAEAKVVSGKVVITAKAAGQTAAVVKGGSTEQKFVITVRKTYSGNGWL